MNNFKTETGKTLFFATIILLLLALCAGITVGVLSKGFTDWSKFTPSKQEQSKGNGGAIIGGMTGHGVRLMSAHIARENFAANGVSENAETAYTLTATVTPDYALNKSVDWSVAWANTSSEWATGKTVTDYVTVTPTADGALTATVQCLQAFGEQVKVTVASRDNTEAKAECVVEYVKKYDSFGTVEIYKKTATHYVSDFMGTIDTEKYSDCSFWFHNANGIGTLEDTFTFSNFKFALTENGENYARTAYKYFENLTESEKAEAETAIAFWKNGINVDASCFYLGGDPREATATTFNLKDVAKQFMNIPIFQETILREWSGGRTGHFALIGDLVGKYTSYHLELSVILKVPVSSLGVDDSSIVF